MSERSHVDVDGFLPFEQCRLILRRGSALPDVPALVVRSTHSAGTGDDLHFRRTIAASAGGVARAESADLEAVARYRGAVAFLTKRVGNPFPHMVTIGRARNADICVALSAVSKVQAYFVHDASGWFIVDQRSSNGTYVGGRRLDPGEKRALADGADLRLGEAFAVQFLLPATLQARATT